MDGVINMEAGEAIVRIAEPLTDPEVAVMVAVPAATTVASPWLPAVLLMVATAGFEELHVAVVVMFWGLPPANAAVAVNCCCV